MAQMGKAVGDVGSLFIQIVVYALIVGSILGASAFTSLTIINTTALQSTFGSFVTAITALIVVGGTILGVMWIMPYVKKLLGKKSGLNMSA